MGSTQRLPNSSSVIAAASRRLSAPAAATTPDEAGAACALADGAGACSLFARAPHPDASRRIIDHAPRTARCSTRRRSLATARAGRLSS